MQPLYLFDPESDLALARDVPNYCAPPYAVAMRRAGACLPMWYGREPGPFVTEGINALWFETVSKALAVKAHPWDHDCDSYMPQPWGWSRAVKKFFALQGFPESKLPDDGWLAHFRSLAGRKSSCVLSRRIADAGLLPRENVAQEIQSVDEADEYCKTHPDAIFKLPWSSSGRGQIRVAGSDAFAAQKQAVAGALNRYGYISAEPFVRDKACDFAMLFYAHPNGAVSYEGLSLFTTAPGGEYTGNILASDSQIMDLLTVYSPGVETNIRALAEAYEDLLAEYIDGTYTGPLGIDMMIRSDGTVLGCTELNLRMTMGFLAHEFRKNFCTSDSPAGKLSIIRDNRPHCCADPLGSARIKKGKFCKGILDLTPPDRTLVFRATIP